MSLINNDFLEIFTKVASMLQEMVSAMEKIVWFGISEGTYLKLQKLVRKKQVNISNWVENAIIRRLKESE